MEILDEVKWAWRQSLGINETLIGPDLGLHWLPLIVMMMATVESKDRLEPYNICTACFKFEHEKSNKRLRVKGDCLGFFDSK